MGNSPWQFEAVLYIELPGYPWVTLEGRATWSTGNPSLVTLPQSTQKRLEFLKIGVNGSAGILCKLLQVIITSGKLKYVITARRIKQALAQPHLQLEYSWSKERTGEISGEPASANQPSTAP